MGYRNGRANYLLQISFWLLLVAVTILFLLPAQYLSPEVFDWWDKSQHALAFWVLTVLGMLSYQKNNKQRYLVILSLILYGALIECLQTLSGWRFGDIWDWVADSAGIILGWVCFSVVKGFRNHEKLQN
jgi:VanZ family protein